MSVQPLIYYIDRYLDSTITAGEWRALQELLKNKASQEQLDAIMDLQIEQYASSGIFFESARESIKKGVFEKMRVVDDAKSIQGIHSMHFLQQGWLRYVAAIILLLGIGTYLWITNKKNTQQPAVAQQTIVDIAPGTNKAILTTGNQTITLSNDKTGITIGPAITYNDGERIADAGQTLQLATPRGGQYQAVLPDGTKVWLNAASSIKFPSKFSGDKRRVEVTGEVYMEVAKNLNAPFSVTTGNTTIQVLGTSFNISAYPDEESQRTTLISGSVRVVANNQSAILQPGQQASIPIIPITKIKQITVQTTDTEKVIAWKNGLFDFNGLTFDEIMRQLERWYDIKVVYENNKVLATQLAGKMTRGVSLNGLLERLEKMGIHYKLNNRTLMILGN